LESNPEVLTNYMRQIGMPNKWAVCEVFGFDEEFQSFIPPPVVGVIAAVERLKEDPEQGIEDN